MKMMGDHPVARSIAGRLEINVQIDIWLAQLVPLPRGSWQIAPTPIATEVLDTPFATNNKKAHGDETVDSDDDR